jgi:DNA-binding PadR family transcriptional regulator/plasmid stabilization system protein ParE
VKRYRVSKDAHRDLDDIFAYWADRASSEIAGRLIDAIVERFWILGEYPSTGRACDELAPVVRCFPAGQYLIYTAGRGSAWRSRTFSMARGSKGRRGSAGADRCATSSPPLVLVSNRYVVILTMARKPQAGPATDPELLILSSLAEGPKHGYAILTDIETFAAHSMGAGTLYTAITRLVEKGWIAAEPVEGRQRPYRITCKGLGCLEEQLAQMQLVARIGLKRLRTA